MASSRVRLMYFTDLLLYSIVSGFTNTRSRISVTAAPQGQLSNLSEVPAYLRLLHRSTPPAAAVHTLAHPGIKATKRLMYGQMGVDGHVYRHHPPVQGLPVLSSRCPSQPGVLPHPPGPGGTPPKVQGRFQPPPHGGGLLLSMVGGFPTREYQHQVHRRHFRRRLGGTLRRPRPHHVRPRPRNSAQNSGLSCLSAWALYTTSLQPTILRPAEW